MKQRNKSVKIYRIKFPDSEKGAKQRRKYEQESPRIKDTKAQDKKANGVLNRTDKKTTINIQTDYS